MPLPGVMRAAAAQLRQVRKEATASGWSWRRDFLGGAFCLLKVLGLRAPRHVTFLTETRSKARKHFRPVITLLAPRRDTVKAKTCSMFRTHIWARARFLGGALYLSSLFLSNKNGYT